MVVSCIEEHDSPLALIPEEIETACRILGVEVPVTHQINTLKKRVVVELWSRGYWLGRGANFGADYLAYEGNPQVYHAALLVVIKEWNTAISMKALTAMSRLATTVKKHAILATEDPQGRIVFVRFRWKGV
jgi:tRNA-intron lyase